MRKYTLLHGDIYAVLRNTILKPCNLRYRLLVNGHECTRLRRSMYSDCTSNGRAQGRNQLRYSTTAIYCPMLKGYQVRISQRFLVDATITSGPNSLRISELANSQTHWMKGKRLPVKVRIHGSKFTGVPIHRGPNSRVRIHRGPNSLATLQNDYNYAKTNEFCCIAMKAI